MTEIIDEDKPKRTSKPSTITVEVIRSIGHKGSEFNGIPDMAGPGSLIDLPRDVAKKLQDVGAVKVDI